MSLVIFGSHGYMGSAIATECVRRGVEWREGRREDIQDLIVQVGHRAVDLVVNAAAYIPMPTVDACKDNPGKTISGNVWWPSMLRDACAFAGKPLMHLSTACLFDEQCEYTENEKPLRGWDGYCGFYVGTKILAEQIVSRNREHYILRLRLPFDGEHSTRNYLNKLARFTQVYEHVNSLTHRGDFAKWCLDLWEKRAPFGTYHCVNTGQISAADLVSRMEAKGLMTKGHYQLVKSPDTTGARLSNAKLAAAIGPIRSVEDAVNDAMTNWKPCTAK